MARVAIIGSCITRDLWAGRGDSFEHLLYVSRTSLASLFAPPIDGFRAAETPPAGLGPFQHRALVGDVAKTALDRLAAFRPSHLIFDFIDERFDLLATAGSRVTGSWELETSGYLAQDVFAGARRIPRLSEECDRLWRAGVAQLARTLAAGPLAEARLILHSARWAQRKRSADGTERELTSAEAEADIAAHNELLGRYDAAFRQLIPRLEQVEAPAHRIADEAHVWGLSPFHYVPSYYAAIIEQLAPLGIVVEAAPAAGSG